MTDDTQHEEREPVAWALYAVTPNGRFEQDVYFDRERVVAVQERTAWTHDSEIVPLYGAPPEQGRELKREGLRSELDAKVEEFRRATKDRIADLDVSERERHADLRRALRFADEVRALLQGEA